MKCRNRSYSNPPGTNWSAVTTPATPSMSTEIYTFNFFAESAGACAKACLAAMGPSTSIAPINKSSKQDESETHHEIPLISVNQMSCDRDRRFYFCPAAEAEGKASATSRAATIVFT